MDKQLQESRNRARLVGIVYDACRKPWRANQASYPDILEEAKTQGISERDLASGFYSALASEYITQGAFDHTYTWVECCCEECDELASEDSELEPGEKVCFVCKEIEEDRL